MSDLAALAGDDEDGLAIAEEAVRLRREAVAANRGLQLPGLALSLSNLATKQAVVDRREALETHRAANLFALVDALYAQSQRFAGPGSKQARRQAREWERQAGQLFDEVDAAE